MHTFFSTTLSGPRASYAHMTSPMHKATIGILTLYGKVAFSVVRNAPMHSNENRFVNALKDESKW